MSQDCLVDIIITMNKNCKGGTDMATAERKAIVWDCYKKKTLKNLMIENV